MAGRQRIDDGEKKVKRVKPARFEAEVWREKGFYVCDLLTCKDIFATKH